MVELGAGRLASARLAQGPAAGFSWNFSPDRPARQCCAFSRPRRQRPCETGVVDSTIPAIIAASCQTRPGCTVFKSRSVHAKPDGPRSASTKVIRAGRISGRFIDHSSAIASTESTRATRHGSTLRFTGIVSPFGHRAATSTACLDKDRRASGPWNCSHDIPATGTDSKSR